MNIDEIDNISIYDIFIEIFLENIKQELNIKKVREGIELSKEEYTQIIQYIKENCLKKKKEIKKLNEIKPTFTLISIIGTIGGKKYKEIKVGAKKINKATNDTKKNFNDVLKGIKITSNYIIEENILNLIEQTDSTMKYYESYVKFIKMVCLVAAKNKNYHSMFEHINQLDITTMEENRKKVLSLSKKYKKQQDNR